MTALLKKYDLPTPRYTSYPTLPYWQKEAPQADRWLTEVKRQFDQNRAMSLYIHMPFCEQLCTYCACNKRITKRHSVEKPYMDALLHEWAIYRTAMKGQPLLEELHLGGGTPTFFSPENLRELLSWIVDTSSIAPQHNFSFEAHSGSSNVRIAYSLGV
ncbi:MAG: coproporphyrinogen III oxidase, partial [Bacteroidota bacterium]